jgi:hypothetical protein
MSNLQNGHRRDYRIRKKVGYNGHAIHLEILNYVLALTFAK